MTQNSTQKEEIIEHTNPAIQIKSDQTQQHILKTLQNQKPEEQPQQKNDIQINQIDQQDDEDDMQEQENQIKDQLKLNQENSLQISSKIQNHLKNVNSNTLNNEKLPSCNCKKSKCLKMYCDCYAKGIKCRDTCKCSNCENTKNNLKQKKPDRKNDSQIQKSEDSNKKSVKPKQKFCNCKKSFCLKKYCECFHASQPCGEACKCEDCKNNGQNNGGRSQPKGKIQIDLPILNGFLGKQSSELVNEINRINEKKQQQVISKKKQKLDEDQIQTKISQILKLVPQQNYQTMLDFLAYCLS